MWKKSWKDYEKHDSDKGPHCQKENKTIQAISVAAVLWLTTRNWFLVYTPCNLLAHCYISWWLANECRPAEQIETGFSKMYCTILFSCTCISMCMLAHVQGIHRGQLEKTWLYSANSGQHLHRVPLSGIRVKNFILLKTYIQYIYFTAQENSRVFPSFTKSQLMPKPRQKYKSCIVKRAKLLSFLVNKFTRSSRLKKGFHLFSSETQFTRWHIIIS